MVTTYYASLFEFLDTLIIDQNDFECYSSVKSLSGLSKVFEQSPEAITEDSSAQYQAIQALLAGEQT